MLSLCFQVQLTHATLPSPLLPLTLPLGQAEQATFPLEGLNVFTGHAAHASLRGYWPAPHVHAPAHVDPAGEVEPLLQGEHDDAPATLYVFTGHWAQLAPAVPAGQVQEAELVHTDETQELFTFVKPSLQTQVTPVIILASASGERDLQYQPPLQLSPLVNTFQSFRFGQKTR